MGIHRLLEPLWWARPQFWNCASLPLFGHHFEPDGRSHWSTDKHTDCYADVAADGHTHCPTNTCANALHSFAHSLSNAQPDALSNFGTD